MIYLTNDALDQAVYFELRGKQPHRRGNIVEQVYFGLLGNGVHEVPVTMTRSRGSFEVAFGKSELFSLVEEDTVRRMLGEVITRKPLH
ncbi:hypothetical protein GMSM_12720 [Geomonas sp. Red276]